MFSIFYYLLWLKKNKKILIIINLKKNLIFKKIFYVYQIKKINL